MSTPELAFPWVILRNTLVRNSFLLPIVLLCACSEGGVGDEPRVLYASVPPLAAVVSRIAGEEWTVGSIARPGQDPHTLALTPAESVSLAKASVYFSAGSELEANILARIRGPRVVDWLAGADHPAVHEDGDSHDQDHDHDHGHGIEPHVWLDPDLLIAFAERVSLTLAEEDPAQAGLYAQNYQQFSTQVRAAVDQARKVLTPAAGRRFYVQHDAFSRFADYFGLEQVALETHGREASARDLRRLAEQARRDRVRIIWVQPQHNVAPAQELARTLGAELRELDPVPEDPVAGIVHLARLLAEGFALEGNE